MNPRTKTALVQEVRRAAIHHGAFRNEAAMVESLAESCRGKRTTLLTGSYTVREGPLTPAGDRRLLGLDMFLTIELCARVYRKCAESGIETPAIVLLPNDIAPGIFSSSEETQAFKRGYVLPGEVRALLMAAGLTQEPLYFFARRFDSPKDIQRELRLLRARIAEGSEKLIVTFESYAENLAAKSLKRGKLSNPRTILACSSSKEKGVIAPAVIVDNLSEDSEPRHENRDVKLTHPNGAPFCSFLAATLFRELEKLGFEQMLNTFVPEEYPCVDKAAIAYRHLYEGKMRIRNIYLAMRSAELSEGVDVIHDNTIL